MQEGEGEGGARLQPPVRVAGEYVVRVLGDPDRFAEGGVPGPEEGPDICGDAPLAGWAMTDVNGYCGKIANTSYVSRTIRKVDGMAAGSTVNICGDAVPPGWVSVGDNNTCARVAMTSYLGRTIRNVSGPSQAKGAASMSAAGDEGANASTAGSAFIPGAAPAGKSKRTAFDFDLDGKADISVFRRGSWVGLNADGLTYRAVNLGADAGRLVPADFDGDGGADLAVFSEAPTRPEGAIFKVRSGRGSSTRDEQLGRAGDVPLAGDWDGDGRADPTVYRRADAGGAQGAFLYRLSGAKSSVVHSISLGAAGELPVLGDFDGDGRTDAAVFRPSMGTWLLRLSGDGGLRTLSFGSAGDLPVVADYDGDGRADPAVYRDGNWFLLNSSDGRLRVVTFGEPGDRPVPASFVSR